MNLGAVLARGVERDPRALAVVDGDRRRAYGEWLAEISAVAGGLRRRGIGPGDRLLVVLSNRRETATLYWACQMLGAVFTPFNWRAGGEEIAYVLDDAEPAAAVFEERSRAAVAEALGRGSATVALDVDDGGFDALASSDPVDGPAGVDEREPCLMLYTSGTTGRPKGVPRSHRAERLAATHCIALLNYRYRSSTLGAMPMFHTMGVRSMLMSALLSGALVCLPAWDAKTAMALIERERIDTLFLVPTMFHDMLHHPERGDHDLSSARNLAYAGMSMTTALTELCAREFAPDRFSNFYGSSEIFTFTVCGHVAEKPGCAGRAGIGQIVRVVEADPDGRSRPGDVVENGRSGEIIAPMDGPEAFAGYWRRPDAAARAIRDGWYFTGDLGRFDEDGELHVVGRVDDMINSGGENIHPEEVEDVLAKSPLVEQAAVVGLPDERMGAKVVAFVEPASAACAAGALDAWCLESALARFKRPRAYVFVRTIPRSASGKLLRRLLREGDHETLDGFESTL